MSHEWGKRVSIHLEINNICNAHCPMCYDRNYVDENNRLRSYGRSRQKSVSIEKVRDWFGDEFFERHSIKRLTICGTESEPMLNDDIGSIVEFFASRQPNTTVRISTNGSVRDKSWWRELGELFAKYEDRVQIVFGIDGVGKSHEKYRIGTSYEQVMLNAKAYIVGGGKAVWQFLVFMHNEHETKQARELATKLGFYDFYLKYTNYFRREDIEELRFEYKEREYSLKESWQGRGLEQDEVDSENRISCYSMKMREVFIDTEGYVYPCSWVKSSLRNSFGIEERIEARKLLEGFRSEDMNLNNRGLVDIIDNSGLWDRLKESWNDQERRSRICEAYCGMGVDNVQCSFVVGEKSAEVRQSEVN